MVPGESRSSHDDYVNTGLDWLPKAPSHWQRVRLGRICEMISGSTPSKGERRYWEGSISWVSPKDMKVDEIEDAQDHITDEALRETGIKLVEPPAVLIVVRGMILAHSFPVARILRPVTINQDMKALKFSKPMDDGFAVYLLSGLRDIVLAEVEEAAHGTRRLTTDRWKQIETYLPPPGEQSAIADFLNRETTKIDELIDKKQRLIDLLEEKRTALITRAVTKGLNPDAEMEDSGVEWFGSIPTHWETVPLNRCWSVIDCKHRTVPFVDDGIPVASIGEVTSLEVDLSRAKHTTPSEYAQMIQGGRKPEKGDIVYSRNATVGAAGYVATEEEFCLGQDVCLIRSRDQSQRFLLHVLRSPAVLEQLEELMVGTTFRRINVGQINRLLVTVPPLSEQVAVARRCDAVHQQHADLMAQVESALDLLKEYRAALISAAITGKIDVRKAAT